MVVFQCENCGEAVKKPKADQHARQCRGFKGYVCIDCMKKFTGDSYKQHTSCISEAQKYQGALYVAPKVLKKPTNIMRVDCFTFHFFLFT